MGSIPDNTLLYIILAQANTTMFGIHFMGQYDKKSANPC